MTDLLESMRQTFLDPVTRHAILVHTPIVIGLLAIPFVAVLPCLGKRPAIAYRLLTATILFLAAVVAGRRPPFSMKRWSFDQLRVPSRNGVS